MEDLIFDRTQYDVDYAAQYPGTTDLKGCLNASDLIRICKWCNYIAQELQEMKIEVKGYTKLDESYQYNTQMRRSLIENIVKHIELVRTSLGKSLTIDISIEDTLTFQKLNNMEKILYELQQSIINIEKSYIPSGIGYLGESSYIY